MLKPKYILTYPQITYCPQCGGNNLGEKKRDEHDRMRTKCLSCHCNFAVDGEYAMSPWKSKHKYKILLYIYEHPGCNMKDVLSATSKSSLQYGYPSTVHDGIKRGWIKSERNGIEFVLNVSDRVLNSEEEMTKIVAAKLVGANT